MLTVIGNTTVDIFVRGIQRLPDRAEDEFSNASFVWTHEPVVPTLGGNAGNTAYVFASLGGQARLWSAVGTDPQGELAIGWLRRAGVDTEGLEIREDVGTSTTTVISDLALRRHTYHYPGASQVYRPHRRSPGGPGDWLLATGYTLLPGWRGTPIADLLMRAHESGISTALDFGPALTAPVTRDELLPMLPGLSLLISNRFELEQATRLDMEEGAAWALSGGAGAVVVKLGVEGAAIFGSDGTAVRVPCFPTEVSGTVGAGDAFNAGLLFAHSKGAALEESARFGNATAALVIGSLSGILDAPSAVAVRSLVQNRGY